MARRVEMIWTARKDEMNSSDRQRREYIVSDMLEDRDVMIVQIGHKS